MKTFTALALALVLSACEIPKTEYSRVLSEPAEVTEVVYTPAQHGSAIGPTFSSSGSIGLAVTSVSTSEVHAVVFKCQHGKFIVKRKEVWEKTKPGMKGTVRYREVYRTTSKTKDLIDYRFIDFTPSR